jgi:hypothetical protein
MSIKILEQDCELGKVLPLKIRDWKALKAKGITMKDMGGMDVTEMADMAGYVLKLAGYDINADDLSIKEVGSVIAKVAEAEGIKSDRPT